MANGWAASGIVIVMAVGIGITTAARNWIYPLPIAWGLAGVAVAEQADKPTIALLAGGVAVLLLVTSMWVGTHRRILVPLAPGK
jgi:hypothetical protein